MMHDRTRAGATLLLLATVCLLASDARADKVQYNRDVRPILNENCFACHGADSASRKAELRLDQREAAVKAEAIVPGHPEKSALIERINATRPGKIMPPPKTHKTLTAGQKETLRRWIAEGAEYQLHWSFIPPTRPQPPAVKDTAWARNPIDNFILAELERHGLKPAPEADRRTLARRLSLDLIGLPPEPAEVEAFVQDKSPDAYERYVDQLLRSPHWGEHRARYWLDLARYADTHGIHFDNYREIWAYRDWVINAFNRNEPFDQFTIDQLAGDLIPNHTLDQQVATGFNRCNISTNEGGAINEEYLVLYTRDRTETVGSVWMGLTVNCAVCHDHKFDPISQREFYSMAAFFNNTTQAAMDGNIKDTPPILFVPRLEDRPRWDAVVKELTEARKQADARNQAARADFDRWLKTVRAEEINTLLPSEGLRLHAPLTEGEGKLVTLQVDGKARTLMLNGGFTWDAGHVAAKAFKAQPGGVLEVPEVGDFEKDQAFSYGAWVKIPKVNGLTGSLLARMDDQHDYRGWDVWLQNNRIATHIINKWPNDALKVVARTPLKPGEWHHVFVSYDGSSRAAGVKLYVDGKPQETDVEADALKSTIRTAVPFKVAQRHTTSRINDLAIQDIRIYGRLLSTTEVVRVGGGARAAWLAAKPAEQRTAAETTELFDWWLPALDPAYQALSQRVGKLQQEEASLRNRGTTAYVMQEKDTEPMAYVLYRGEYDKRRDPVKTGTPHILAPMPPDLPRNRLGFARWLLQPDQPLTTRVTVNRYWQEIFGTGLVRSSGDFGTTGEAPSHPELLDWLAVEFRESGWDVKRFYKLLVTSATYRQAALTTPEKLEKDPQNRLLSHGPRFRLDAEMLRDYALAASGLLTRKVGGPSVKPYQPEGVWEAVAMIGSNTRDYKRDNGDALYRRSMYTFWKRAAPPASMEILNAPSREFCTVRRERTDTPLQALVTLNDPQFIEAARALAQSAVKQKDAAGFMAGRLLGRPLRPEETRVVQTSVSDLLAFYRAHPDDAKKLIAVGEAKPDASLDAPTLAAWTMLANEMLNLDEVLNK